MATDPERLEQYIRDLGLNFKESPQSFIFNCPLCNARQRLYIRKRDGRFTCFKCATTNSFSGSAEYAIKALTNLSIKEIKNSLYSYNYIKGCSSQLFELEDPLDQIQEDFEETEEEERPKPLTWPYYALLINAPGALKGAVYLESRGIPLDIASHYNIRYSVQDRAIMFPICFQDGLYGWQYRTIEPTKRIIDGRFTESIKTWSSDNLPRESMVMFADQITSDYAVLCEGPIDAIKAHKFGGNIASMGKIVGPKQIGFILKRGVKRVYSALDPDAFGELIPLMKKFGSGVEMRQVVLPQKKGIKVDLGSLSMDEAYELIENAESMSTNKIYSWYDV